MASNIAKIRISVILVNSRFPATLGKHDDIRERVMKIKIKEGAKGHSSVKVRKAEI